MLNIASSWKAYMENRFIDEIFDFIYTVDCQPITVKFYDY